MQSFDKPNFSFKYILAAVSTTERIFSIKFIILQAVHIHPVSSPRISNFISNAISVPFVSNRLKMYIKIEFHFCRNDFVSKQAYT